MLTPILATDDPHGAAAVFYEAHRWHAESVTELAVQPWGERAFHAVLLGYQFLIAADSD